MSTKILHVSDTHLGKQQYGSKIREKDYSRAFDASVDIAIEENVDAVIHTGDLFDSRTPDTGSVSDAFQTIKRLEDNDITFLGIVGNHERKWDDQWLDIFETLNNVHRLSTDPFIVNDEVAVYGFDSIRQSEWESMNFNLEEPSSDYVTCVCMHELFLEFMSPTKADRKLSEVIERMNFNPDIIPLGDYHSAEDQEVSGVPAFYAGATERTSATTVDPTVRIIRANDNEIESYNWRKIQGAREGVPRPFYTVSVDLTDSSTRGHVERRVLENVPDEHLSDCVVVVNLDGSNDSPVTPSEVYEVLESIGIKVPYVSDKRNPEILEFDSSDVADPTSINMEEMINNEVSEDVSDKVKKIDREVVRDLTVNKSDIREIVDDKFQVSEEGDKNEN